MKHICVNESAGGTGHVRASVGRSPIGQLCNPVRRAARRGDIPIQPAAVEATVKPHHRKRQIAIAGLIVAITPPSEAEKAGEGWPDEIKP